MLPSGPAVAFELKLDGFRTEAIKSAGKVHLRPLNDKDFNSRYPAIAKALAAMPDETVIDAEIGALDLVGSPRSTPSRITLPPRPPSSTMSSTS
jgi:bifunctional non-homologous end joining protein LigD